MSSQWRAQRYDFYVYRTCAMSQFHATPAAKAAPWLTTHAYRKS